MIPKICHIPTSDYDFMEQFILPAHYSLANGSGVRFCIRNLQEQIIICSNDYAQETGFGNFKEIMYKQPDVDYERIISSPEQFKIQMSYLKKHKRNFHFIYKDVVNKGFYMTVSEPILNFKHEVIGKKECDVRLKMLSHRQIIESHFKNYSIDVISLENILENIELTNREEVVLFMLIGGYSQQEIGQFLNLSRTAILELVC